MNEFHKIQNKLIHVEKIEIITSAIITANILNDYDEEVRQEIINWADGKDVSAFVSNEVSVTDLKEELGCTSFQALCILNALKKNSDCFEDAVFAMWKDVIL